MTSTRWKHTLPMGEGSIGERFKTLCIQFDAQQVHAAREHVRHLLVDLAKIDHPLFHQNLRAAVWLAESSMRLIERFESMSGDHQRLAIGAIRYFLIRNDSVQDMRPELGFADDCLVMQHSLEQLGMLQEMDEANLHGSPT